MMRRAMLLAAALLAAGPGRSATVQDLVRAYPESLAGVEGTNLVWRDGTRMPLGSVVPGRAPEAVMDHGSIMDQLDTVYPAGAPLLPPAGDPGRVRNQAFFDKMYGDCRAGAVAPKMVRITWLPRSWGHAISVSPENGLAERLEAVSRELDELPAEFRRYLFPIAGTYNCRVVAGTGRTSMHSWGAAIDLNTAYSDYWRWSRTGEWRNRIPPEVVAAFERHGFIWGGRWSHFDTMHFEYRPELLQGGP